MKNILLTTLAMATALHAADSWSGLGKPTAYQNGAVYSITNYKGDLYVTGFFDSTKFNAVSPPASLYTRRVVRWNGTEFSAVGAGVKSAYEMFASYVYKDELYVGGDRLDSAGSVKITNNVARWNGTDWNSVGTDAADIGMVYTFCEYKGDLYVGGKLGLNKWNGTAWTNLAISKQAMSVFAMKIYKDELYVGGSFTTLGTTKANNLVKFDGTTWSAVADGVIFNQEITPDFILNKCRVAALEVFDGDLYIGGDIDSAGAMKANNLVRWNGKAFAEVSGGVNSSIRALQAHGANLYVAGYFWKSGTAAINTDRASVWNGKDWKELGSLASGGNALAVLKDTLYGLGRFDLLRWSGNIGAGTTALNASTGPDAAMNLRYDRIHGNLILNTPDFHNASATVYGLDGRLLYSENLMAEFTALRIGFLTKGKYFLVVKSRTETTTHTFLKY